MTWAGVAPSIVLWSSRDATYAAVFDHHEDMDLVPLSRSEQGDQRLVGPVPSRTFPGCGIGCWPQNGELVPKQEYLERLWSSSCDATYGSVGT